MQRAGFTEYPPHLDRQWTNDDRMDRPDPKLPLLPKNRDMLWVDDYYDIAIEEALSHSDSEDRRL